MVLLEIYKGLNYPQIIPPRKLSLQKAYNGSEAILKLSSNDAGDSNDENNFLDQFLLTNTQISKLFKAFANRFSANMKLLKTQLHKIEQSEGFLGGLLKGHF